jgi:hypothetical protein
MLALCAGAVSQVVLPEISGFGQMRYDGDNAVGFSIQKVRICLKGPIENGVSGIGVRYDFFADFGSADGLPKIGFASLIFKFQKNWLPEIIIGRTLDGISYQFPGPAKIAVLNYPVAYFNTGCGTGIYLREIYGKWWAMVGLINGTAGYKDDNKSLDFTGRITYTLPLGLTSGTIYQYGKQPTGDRKIYGGDLAWKLRGVWINGGQNIYEFNGRQTARWIWSTIDVTKVIQFVGLVESLEREGETTNGWTAGVNLNITPKTVIRLDYFKSAKDETRGFGMLFQQSF